eukprot:TRINITY_DN997_c0_g1_i2.p1 TRINITY_DN997_c0_g1~~TRINITY_DN997_c0_g1_i2.p1  ORF type:complete len:96 (+),score=23.24 TRINITY_DN997_c0_g1_i2:268-555(+)
MWITESKKYTTTIDCLFLNTPIELCKERAKSRKNHPTLDIDKVDVVIDEFARGLSKPETWEGYTNLMISNNTDEVKQHVEFFKKLIEAQNPTKKK